MKTYYITDSTIFNKAEDIVAALNEGKTIRNDDANIQFVIKNKGRRTDLFVRDALYDFEPDNWFYIQGIKLDNPKKVVDAMDRIVEDVALHHDTIRDLTHAWS